MSIAENMTVPLRDKPRLVRIFTFIREHQDQTRVAGDEVREMKFTALLDKLVDHL